MRLSIPDLNTNSDILYSKFILFFAAIDPCGVNPCRNGGTCTAVVDEFKCICPMGYKGDRCEGNTHQPMTYK